MRLARARGATEPCDEILYVRAKVYAGDQHATVTITGDHTSVVAIEKMGEGLCFIKDASANAAPTRDPLAQVAPDSLREIYDFVSEAPARTLEFMLEAGAMNNALSKKGLRQRVGIAYRPDAKAPGRQRTGFR